MDFLFIHEVHHLVHLAVKSASNVEGANEPYGPTKTDQPGQLFLCISPMSKGDGRRILKQKMITVT